MDMSTAHRERETGDLMKVFDNKRAEGSFVKIAAPMVRYSKLPFRMLLRPYDVDVVFSPMIISHSFVRSERSREVEFTTLPYTDQPLVLQFAASNPQQLGDAAEFVTRHCEGIDLNCGCPQQWAMDSGYGSHLISDPQMVFDMVSHARNRTTLPISVKVRVHDTVSETVEMARRIEKCGAAFLSVHGRTPKQRYEPVNYDIIRQVKDAVNIPVVANGDANSLEQANSIVALTGVDGVMTARGLLRNPAMFKGYDTTPIECVQRWVDIRSLLGFKFDSFRHILAQMLVDVLSKQEMQTFNRLNSTAGILDFLSDYGIEKGDAGRLDAMYCDLMSEDTYYVS
ncbi:hypothetical protein SARC_07213 [Sphaeroforma arctica JP610]|uniref:DUS-like FMN-binding domain-containing protein n=1 Tax=Sphaeroforma arctica JP610 TaxID=667725 RepID=A0A0L0FUA0_9EUKA|nr:hypothetical protein SARC_07213 [Sphaeroforma arctica JP610]KNC80425.1 hypothetical protein SARC_07213 [Sphaeroforma arctica JP610]|eukprot:XP_014154327.1 hypothetical protein SARC_07213 [Sphaeroforma arctica JP610]